MAVHLTAVLNFRNFTLIRVKLGEFASEVSVIGERKGKEVCINDRYYGLVMGVVKVPEKSKGRAGYTLKVRNSGNLNLYYDNIFDIYEVKENY